MVQGSNGSGVDEGVTAKSMRIPQSPCLGLSCREAADSLAKEAEEQRCQTQVSELHCWLAGDASHGADVDAQGWGGEGESSPVRHGRAESQVPFRCSRADVRHLGI